MSSWRIKPHSIPEWKMRKYRFHLRENHEILVIKILNIVKKDYLMILKNK